MSETLGASKGISLAGSRTVRVANPKPENARPSAMSLFSADGEQAPAPQPTTTEASSTQPNAPNPNAGPPIPNVLQPRNTRPPQAIVVRGAVIRGARGPTTVVRVQQPVPQNSQQPANPASGEQAGANGEVKPEAPKRKDSALNADVDSFINDILDDDFDLDAELYDENRLIGFD